uniref:Crinkler effector protein N-terminal domain-containing protein n=1 Tax=Globisporangium ultimum (strain ATCC 200006 / CBS 805.95 / DAOM BR144) TaxID=431595 RepID=K3WHA1_GLOUD
MILKQCVDVGDLPQEGEFLKLFEWTDDDCGTVMDIKVIDDIVHFTGSKFYMRKEILCVLKNFKNIYQNEFDTGEMVNKQFILMGSPGTGKSCILALLCFFIAIKEERPVVWFRQVFGGRGKLGGSITRLFYQGKYYQWKDEEGTKYRSLYDAMENIVLDTKACWYFLDGLNQKEILERKWSAKFTLLATSGQFDMKSEPGLFQQPCLLPYWKQVDLEDLADKLKDPKESDVDNRYFVSGGSLREFLNVDARTQVAMALKRIETSKDAENLLTSVGSGSDKQIDRIRTQGVEDSTNARHYVDPFRWTCCVSSKLVLQHLAAMMKPNFFEKLMGIARGMNDDRLEGVAFEGYFHTLVRHRRSVCVHYCKYDNVGRRTNNNWENIMRQEMGSIDWKELSVVECEGENREECVAMMESWAANPSEMDYWIPATSLCETIDAVAKWTLPGNQVRFCFLQLTKATTHKCNAAILWELAQPFVNKQLPVCYITLIPDEDKRLEFRLSPVQITKKEVLDHIPLYVAHFEILD